MNTNLITKLRRNRTVASTAIAGVAAGLICTGLGATSDVAAAAQGTTFGTAAVLQSQDFRGTGLAVDSGTLGTKGDQPLGDAGRFDEGCLWEKTMRNITGAKAFPAPGTAAGYADVSWQSSTDKRVWVNESIAEGRTMKATDHYLAILTSEIKNVKNCQEAPGQGHYYGKPQTLKVDDARVTYYLDYQHNGSTAGGGVAVVRHGNRFGFVSLMSGRSTKPDGTLRALATRAAMRLG